MGDSVAVWAKRNQIAGRIDYGVRIEDGNRGNVMYFDEARRHFSVPATEIEPACLAMATPDSDGGCPVAAVTFVPGNPLDACSAFFVAAGPGKLLVIAILYGQQCKDGCGESSSPGQGCVKLWRVSVGRRFQAAA